MARDNNKKEEENLDKLNASTPPTPDSEEVGGAERRDDPKDAPKVDKVELPEEKEQHVVKKEEPELRYTSGPEWDVDPTNRSLSASPMQGSDVSRELEKIARSNEQIEGLLASIQSTLSEGLELRI